MSDKIKIHDKYFSILIEEQAILDKVKELANTITQDYNEKPLLIISILNGSFIFGADLIRNLPLQTEIEFIKVASYEGTSSTGQVKNMIGLNKSVSGKNILILEDIIESGNTIAYLLEDLKKQNIDSIEVVTLLFKPLSLKHEIDIKYVGFEIEDDFVVGYGLDYDGLGRNLKGIYQVV